MVVNNKINPESDFFSIFQIWPWPRTTMSFEIVYSSLACFLLWSFHIPVICISGSAYLTVNMLHLHLKLTLFLLSSPLFVFFFSL